MGTPDFAVATLDAIYHSEHEIVGVVTAPDKPAGRGLILQCSDVKKYAIEKGISISQPVKLKDPKFIEVLKQWQADVFVVVAFRMLPFEVYSIPKKGTFNIHASLLPQYRGAAPIHWAIMNGETKTGITTFFLNSEIDCGDIIFQKEIDILPDETTGELYDRLKHLGAEVALETIKIIKKGDSKPIPQPHSNDDTKLAPKICKDDTIIDWNCNASDIINKIRGLSPNPGAVTFLTNNDGKLISLKIFRASITPIKKAGKTGEITTDDRSFFYITTKDFQISIHNLQVEGKTRLETPIFLQGNNISNYTIYHI
jgi:methionyl-tRNA formyltransferase